MNKIEQLIDIYIKERQKLLDKIIGLVENEKPGRIGPYEKLIENIDKQIIYLQSLQEPTEERDDICLRCGVEHKEVKREGSNGCHSRGFHYPKHLWK